jgi:hypothetical protein
MRFIRSNSDSDFIESMHAENRRAWNCFGLFFAICGFVAMGFTIVLSRSNGQSVWVPLGLLSLGLIFMGLIFCDAHRFDYFKACRRTLSSPQNEELPIVSGASVREYVITISPSIEVTLPLIIPNKDLISEPSLSLNIIDLPSKPFLNQSYLHVSTPSKAFSSVFSSKSSHCPTPSQIELSRSQIDPPSYFKSCLSISYCPSVSQIDEHSPPNTPTGHQTSQSQINSVSQL